MIHLEPVAQPEQRICLALVCIAPDRIGHSPQRKTALNLPLPAPPPNNINCSPRCCSGRAWKIAALLGVSLVPVLMLLFVRGRITPEAKNPVNRLLIWAYRPFVHFVLRFRWLTLLTALLLMVATVFPFLQLGREFMPPLNEGDILFMPTAVPGMSLTEATRVLQIQDRMLREFPEYEERVCRAHHRWVLSRFHSEPEGGRTLWAHRRRCERHRGGSHRRQDRRHHGRGSRALSHQRALRPRLPRRPGCPQARVGTLARAHGGKGVWTMRRV